LNAAANTAAPALPGFSYGSGQFANYGQSRPAAATNSTSSNFNPYGAIPQQPLPVAPVAPVIPVSN